MRTDVVALVIAGASLVLQAIQTWQDRNKDDD